MEIEIGITCVLLVLLAFLATVDIAFGQLSDVGLRRLISEAEDRANTRATAFLKEISEDRRHFRFVLSAAMQILLVAVSVLITSLSLQELNEFQQFSHERLILIAVLIGVVLAVVFRQYIPRLIAVHNPERTFLSLLPLFRPFYRVISLIPVYRSFDRLRRNEQ